MKVERPHDQLYLVPSELLNLNLKKKKEKDCVSVVFEILMMTHEYN